MFAIRVCDAILKILICQHTISGLSSQYASRKWNNQQMETENVSTHSKGIQMLFQIINLLLEMEKSKSLKWNEKSTRILSDNIERCFVMGLLLWLFCSVCIRTQHAAPLHKWIPELKIVYLLYDVVTILK